MMSIVIYCRYSSHSQNEQSIEGMIADSAKRQFQAIRVYQLDRFARNRYDSATYKNKLKKNGVRVISARENITADASGILMKSVLEGMAEYYSAELSQKIRRGLAINAEKCLYTGARLSLGYDIDENKRYIINEGEAAVVCKIFEMYISSSTMAEIIRYLNENQVKTSRGNDYGKNSIRQILTNRRYKGIYIYNNIEVPNGIPRIIDDIVFEQAQVLLEKNRKAPARTKAIEEYYLLTTKLFCGHCQMCYDCVCGTSQNGSIHQYYQCVPNRKKGGCKKKTVKKRDIEDKVVTEIVNTLTDEYIDDIARKISNLSMKEGNTETIKRLKKLLRENEDATANLVRAIEQGKAVDILSTQIEKRQKERVNLETQLAKEKMMYPTLTFDEVKFFLKNLRMAM